MLTAINSSHDQCWCRLSYQWHNLPRRQSSLSVAEWRRRRQMCLWDSVTSDLKAAVGAAGLPPLGPAHRKEALLSAWNQDWWQWYSCSLFSPPLPWKKWQRSPRSFTASYTVTSGTYLRLHHDTISYSLVYIMIRLWRNQCGSTFSIGINIIKLMINKLSIGIITN